jgi:3-oxoacyl-[acyl-carrier protein] reductase
MVESVFKNKVVLVTGASRGIGRAIAEQFALAGATVIGTATTLTGADNITAYLQAQHSLGCGKVLNVTDPTSIIELIAFIKTNYAAVNVLINNAAITQDNLLLRMKEEEWSSVLETDLTSVFRLAKACVRDMLKAQWGRIINIGSVVGATGNPGQVNYCAAKAGLLGFSKALALEIGTRNITVNTIAPGYVFTDMTEALSAEQQNVILSRIPMQRIGAPLDIAHAALFLASEGAAYITGQTLHVNGGMHMN